METLLGAEGAYVDDIFYCPHHPDKGFAGERPEYKIDCDCRKPKPGMILAAAKKYNIALARSYMIGDSAKDARAGIAAGCRPALIRPAGKTEVIDGTEVPVFASILSSLAFVLKRASVEVFLPMPVAASMPEATPLEPPFK
jgi:histidinol phosphatase-like enzyme